MPEWIENQPQLYVWLEDVMTAFLTLHNRRSFGMGGANPIPLTEMEAYFRMFNVTKIRQKRYYLHMLNALDSLYLRLENERQQREAKSKK